MLGLLLIPPNAWWVIQMEKVRRGPYPTSISLFANVLFILALLVAANAGMRRLRPRWALTQAELMVVYAMTATGSAMCGHDFIPVLVQLMPHVAWFGTPQNRYWELFGQYQPSWLTVRDRHALAGYFIGHSTLYSREALAAWAAPVMWWSLFVLALALIMLALGIIVRAQWVERERLTYPIIELPLQMTASGGHLWRNRLFWLGFGIAAAIDILNGFHFLYPDLPEICVGQQDLAPFFTNKPWSAMGWTPVAFYPFAIGLGYLLPVDLLFSCWFFYLFWKVQLVVTSAQGWDATPQFPFIREQQYGAFFAIMLLLIFNSRRYLVQVVRRVFGLESELDDSTEGMSYRVCVLVIVVCAVFLLGFLVRAGMPLWLAALALALYFVMSITITRIRAELGPPVHDMHFSGPDAMLAQGFGTGHFSARELTALNWFWWFNRAYRSHPMPVFAEGLKAASVRKASQKWFTACIVAAILLGIPSAFWAFLHCAYQYGTATKFNQGIYMAAENYTRLAGWVTAPVPPNVSANEAIGVGFVTALVLGMLRGRFFGFVLHPIGYAISGSWAMNLVWMPLLVAWVLKSLILRYGGLKRFRFLMPFFLGLILGQCVVGCMWSLIGLALNIPAYSFWGA